MAYSPALASPPPDEDDRAILAEAHQGQLAVDDKQEVGRSSEGRFGRAAWTVLTSKHGAERVRTYRVRAADGLAWTYTQPYSASRQMPGEHTFILRGALPQPVQVLPPSNQWRRPRCWMLLLSATLVLLLFLGIGLLVPPLCILLFRPWAKFTSPDLALAKWVGAQPHVKASVKATKFGWLGFLGSSGCKLPWIIQLHSLGDGTSKLVIKAPDVGRWNLMRNRVGFVNAAAIARAFQGILPYGSTAPPQRALSDR